MTCASTSLRISVIALRRRAEDLQSENEVIDSTRWRRHSEASVGSGSQFCRPTTSSIRLRSGRQHEAGDAVDDHQREADRKAHGGPR